MKKDTAIHLSTIEHIAFKLLANDIPFEFRLLSDGAQLRFPWWEDADVVCNYMTAGHLEDYVESMGFPWDEDDVTIEKSNLMAEAIIELYRMASAE